MIKMPKANQEHPAPPKTLIRTKWTLMSSAPSIIFYTATNRSTKLTKTSGDIYIMIKITNSHQDSPTSSKAKSRHRGHGFFVQLQKEF